MVYKLRHFIIAKHIKLIEKKYNKLKYVLKTNKSSKTLIVVFSGFPGKNGASYNYMRTLKDVKCNKLFILDDFGFEKRGSYYLGESGNFFVKELVIQLINQVKKELSIDTLITVGSSKGGTCAIYYGLIESADAIVAGAPQYFIGNYLSSEDKINILKGICGDDTEDSINELNNLLYSMIQQGKKKDIKFFIHYSKFEHTFSEHIIYLLEDLKKSGYIVYTDECDYKRHEDVAVYFPVYLKQTVNSVLNNIEKKDIARNDN